MVSSDEESQVPAVTPAHEIRVVNIQPLEQRRGVLGHLAIAERSADDIGRVAVFLAGPGAAFVTGQVVVVDGGMKYAR